MLPNPPDSGLASDFLRVLQSAYHHEKRRGQRNDTIILLMGATLTFIGASMAMDAFKRIHGEERGR